MASFLDFDEKTSTQDDLDAPLKRVIREMLRTQVCPKTIRLLIDKIHIRKVAQGSARGDETYRMWLTDGELTIQGLLRRELHPFITLGEIREGSFVKITKYELAWGKGIGNRQIVYLRIDDLTEYAEDGREQADSFVHEVAPVLTPSRSRSSRAGYKEQSDGLAEDILADTSVPIDKNFLNDEFEDEEEVDLIKYPDDVLQDKRATAEKVPEKASSKRKREESASPLKESNPNISGSPRKASRSGAARSQEALTKTPPQPPITFPIKAAAKIPVKRPAQSPARPFVSSPAKVAAYSPAKSLPKTPTKHHIQPPKLLPPATPSGSSNMPQTQRALPPTKPIPIPRPLVLSPLSSLVGRNSSRNKPVDVLALVTYVSPETFQRTGAPLGRNIRIMDTSTSKRVLVSVFTCPETFLPKEGDVALFRNVTTHEWDGGSLKAWESWCEGREWFVREEDLSKVKGLEGWEGKVEGLKRLWEVAKED